LPANYLFGTPNFQVTPSWLTCAAQASGLANRPTFVGIATFPSRFADPDFSLRKGPLMKLHHVRSLTALSLAVFLAGVGTARAQTLSSVQGTLGSSCAPLFGKVYIAGSDTLSTSYLTNQSNFLSIINSKLQEGVAFTGAGLNQLDPTRLFFMFDYAPRCYWIYGYAGYVDGYGVTIATVTAPTENPPAGTNYTVMPDIHWNGSNSRTSTYPVAQGDWVQLPTVKAGQQLAFFCYSNENSNGNATNVFYNGASNNADGFQHMIAFFPTNSQYIIIGFEDMYGGGDKDCNDVMFVVDIGPNNAAALQSVTSLPK
jgi:hypothetical protein